MWAERTLLRKLDTFGRALERRESGIGSYSWAEENSEVHQLLPPVLRIAERFDSTLVEPIRSVGEPGSATYLRVMNAVDQLTGIIKHGAEMDRLLGPAGPQLAAGSLHPWVWESASRLWEDGHRREAIQSAATHIDLQLQAKMNSSAAPGSDLVTQAFTTDDPKPSRPRLRFPGLTPATETWRSAHEGAMNFGRGCFMAIRNFATHTLDQPDEQPALELLAALSVLARWIDEAEVMQT